jgi:hypothetical protein
VLVFHSGDTMSPRDDSGFYEIRIRGHLQNDWSAWFEGFEVTNLPDGDALLYGRVTDQAALHGVLEKIRRLGLSLVSLNPADE